MADILRDRSLKRVEVIVSALDIPSRWVGLVTAWLILPLVGVLVYGVIMRYGLNAPPIWTYDITYMLYGAQFMLGAAYTLQRDEHVRADFLYQYLSPRWQSAIDAGFYIVLFFPAIGFFTWVSADYALISWIRGAHIPTSPWMPIIYPLKTVMPVTGALLLIQGLSELIKCIYAIITDSFYSDLKTSSNNKHQPEPEQ